MKRVFIAVIIALALVSCSTYYPKPWQDNWSPIPIKYEPTSESWERLKETKKHIKVLDAEVEEYPVDLPTVLRLAGARNLDITLAKRKVQEAYAGLLLAKEDLFPTFFVGYSSFHHKGQTQATEGNFLAVDKQFVSPSIGVGLRWNLGESLYERLSAKQLLASSYSGLDVTKQEILLKATLAYYELVRTIGIIQAKTKAVEVSEKLVKAVDKALKAGKGFKGDLLRAKAQLSHNKLELIKTKENMYSVSLRLARLLHLKQGITLIPLDLPTISLHFVDEDEKLSTLIARALMNRPEVMKIQKRLGAFLYHKKAVTWGPLIPTVEATGSTGRSGPVLTDLDNTEDIWFTLGWKIGPGGILDRGRIKLADARYRAEEIRLVQLKHVIEEEVRREHNNIVNRLKEIKLAKKGVEEAKESLKINQARQALGVGLPLEVIQAEEALTRALINEVNAVISYNKAQYTLHTKIGKAPK